MMPPAAATAVPATTTIGSNDDKDWYRRVVVGLL